jgi:hypothetical protein
MTSPVRQVSTIGLVRPVHVLDQHRHVPLTRHAQQLTQGVEQPGLLPVAAGFDRVGRRRTALGLRHQASQVPPHRLGRSGQEPAPEAAAVDLRQPPEQVHDREQRQAGGEGHAPPRHDGDTAFGDDPRRLGDQPALADARVTRDQHGSAAAGEDLHHPRQFRTAADQRRRSGHFSM